MGAMISAQLLQLDSPFEQWSARLAHFSAKHDGPREFLAAATSDLVQLPPVVGGEWQCEGGDGRFGLRAPNRATFVAGRLSLVLCAEGVLPRALYGQFQLVAELLWQFYQAKQRERRLADYMYVEAVHETGARLTHDIKNPERID
jgi:hypothetical protein